MQMPTMFQGSRKETGPSSDTRWSVRQFIATQTIGIQELGLRADWDRLNDDDAAELVRLSGKLLDSQRSDVRGERLSKSERKRWEYLVEVAADAPNVFQAKRDEAKHAKSFADLYAETVKRPFTRREEVGLIQELVEQVSGNCADDGGHCIDAQDIAVLTFVLVLLAAGKPAAVGSRVEAGPEGPVLIVNRQQGLFGELDPGSRLSRWHESLIQLSENSWFEVQQGVPEWRITLGVRARAAMGLK